MFRRYRQEPPGTGACGPGAEHRPDPAATAGFPSQTVSAAFFFCFFVWGRVKKKEKAAPLPTPQKTKTKTNQPAKNPTASLGLRLDK